MRDQQEFDDFEKYLQREADKEVLFPSDRVWSNIAKEVQPKTKWSALPIISIIVFISLATATYFNYPPKNILSTLFKYKPQLYPLQQHPIPTTPLAKIVNFSNSVAKQHPPLILVPNTHNGIETRFSTSNYLDDSKEKTLTEIITYNKISTQSQEEFEKNTTKKSYLTSIFSSGNEQFNQAFIVPDNGTSSKIIDAESDRLYTQNIQKHLVSKPFITLIKPTTTTASFDDELPLVLRDIRPTTPMINPWSYEFYGTPSISFRRLEDDMVRNQLFTNTSANSNGLIQKAGIGSEIGAALHYKISSNLSLTMGLQFNIRQYYIRAFNSEGLATVKIVQNNRLDSVNFTSAYSNSAGNFNTRLNNKLYQMAVPLGINWHIFQLKKIGVDLNASIQPTYSLNKNVYIISTDYKYYANGESFFRHWNINSSLGLCFNYQLNKSSIYFGPQLRYQHLPTYNDKYPIKEYRLDYGLRIGFITPLK